MDSGLLSEMGPERENEELRLRVEQLEQLNALHKIGNSVVSTMGLNEGLAYIVDAAYLATKAEEGALMLLDEQTNELYVRVPKRLGEKVAREVQASVEDSIAKKVVDTGEPLRLTSEERTLKVVTGYTVNSVLYVPMDVNGKVIGILYVGNQSPGRPFTETDEHALSVLADHATTAIENARKTRLLAMLHETGQAMLSTSDLDKVLDQIAKSALEVLAADIVVLYGYDEEKDDITVPPITQGKVRELKVLQSIGNSIPHKQSVTFKMIRRGEPFYASDAERDWIKAGLTKLSDHIAGKTFVARERIVSSAGIPLIASDETVGIMFVNYRSHRRFIGEEREAIELFANQAAIAIQNARLVQDKDGRIKRLASLVDISRVMTEPPIELNNVLHRTVKNARRATGSDYALVFLYDSEAGKFQGGLTTSGVSEQLALTIQEPRPNGITTRVVEKGIIVVTDTKNTEKYPFIGRDPRLFLTQAKVQSLVGVRLQVGQEIVGVLYVDFCTSRQFDKDELWMLQLFTNQAAIAIQNAQRFDRVQRRSNELAVLNWIGQEISYDPTLEVEEILELVYQQTARLMDVGNFYIALYEEESDLVNFKFVVERELRQEPGQGIWIDRESGNGITEYIIRSKEPLLIPTAVDKWLDLHEVDLIGPLAKSWVGAPMIVGDKVLGVIGVQSYETENAYDGEHLNVLHTIASQAAIAIQNAGLLRERKQRLDELTDLHDISLEITKQLEKPESLLQDIVRRAARLLEAPGGGLLLREGEKTEVVMQFVHGLKAMLGVKFRFGQGAAGRVAQSGNPLIINDYYTWEGRDQRFDEESYQHLFRSLVLVPLKWQDEVIGALVVVDIVKGRVFAENDVHLLERFANQAAITIQNATLYNDKVRELEALHRVEALLSTMDLEETLQTILDGLSKFIRFDCALIRLWDEEERELVLEAHRGGFPGKISASRKYGVGIVGRVALKREPIVSLDVRRESDYKEWIEAAKDSEERRFLRWIRSEVAVPLAAMGKLVGVMAALSHKKAAFQMTDAELMERFASQAAIALHNAQLIKQSRQHTVLVAHQLRGPLQAIRSDVDYQLGYIQRNYTADDRLNQLHRRFKEHFGRLDKELDNFAFLIRDDLGMKHKYSMNSHPIASVIEKAVAQFREIAQSRGIKINVDSSVRRLPRVRFDWENMLTVFTNLIDNAVKYSHDNHSIYISGEKRGNKVFIEVADFGLGVLPEDEDRLFELYTQGRLKDEKRFVQGTGIGLWVCQQIVEAHSGKITVWSQLFDHPDIVQSGEDVAKRGFLTKFTVELFI